MKWLSYCLVSIGFMLTAPIHAYWSETHQKFADDAIKGNARLSGVENTESMADYYANRLGFSLDRQYIFDNVEPLNPIFDDWTKK